MSDDRHIAEAQRWWRFAKEDLAAAERTMADKDGIPRHVCWLAQQAAEKAIKAALICLLTDFPKTHDLENLVDRLPQPWAVRSSKALSALSEWAVEARYPGNWPEVKQTDAADAVRQAAEILAAVAADLRKINVAVW
jgi:HEPN domain-containing protein